VAVFAADYAGNEVAVAVKVNDQAYEEKTVYVLTNTLTSGEEYLLVSANSVGSAVALGHSGSALATNPVSIKAGNAQTGNAVYIDSKDVAATSVWTATGSGTSFNFNNGGSYLRRTSNSGSTLTCTASTSYANFAWASATSRLSMRASYYTYYLRYVNGAFALNSSAGSTYVFHKTVIRTEVDPDNPTNIVLNPTSLDLYKGNETDLVAKVMHITAEDRTVTWSSSNTSVATVSQDGHVTAVGAGTATITATSNSETIHK
jgi:alpha-amylase